MTDDCGQSGPCAARAPGCARHFMERIAELRTEVDHWKCAAKEHAEAQAAAESEIERITHNMVQTEKHAQIEEREVGRLNDLLNRILGDDGPDIDAYLDGHVEIPSVPGLCMQRDALVKELADLFGWSDRSYLHAAMHVKNAVLNLKADVSTSHEEVDLLTKKLVGAYGLLEQISDELREETECDCPPEWPRCVACRIRLRIQAALPKEKP